MNKYIKKVVYVLAIFSLFIGTTSFAAFSFNSVSNDCRPFIGIANVDSGAGWPDSRGCWTTSNVSAQSGEYINVALYYHNTSTTNEPGVRVKLTNPGTGPSTNYSFSGTLSSPNGSMSLGSVSLSVPSNQTLTYVDTLWYDQAHGFGVGQEISSTTGNQIFGSGFDLGTVGTGWPSQGYVVVKFKVGNTILPPPPPPTTFCQITEFRADPSSTTYAGQPVTLRWTTIGATSVTIDGVQEGPIGSKTVNPTSTRQYTIVVNCSNGQSTSQQVQVYVDTYNPPQNYDRPEATTNSPRNVDEDSATLRGEVDGNGSRIDAWFEMPCYSGSRYGEVYDVYNTDISYNRRNLSPDRRYEYCAVARNNSTGVIDYGDEISFYTEDDNNDNLDITTNNATNINPTSAQLNGHIDTDNSNTTRWFRYGTTSSSMNMTTGATNHGSGSRSFSDTAYNLYPNTTYYYQAVASDSNGTHYDANIKSFYTNAPIVRNDSTSAVTTVATNISTSTAQLNGLLMNTSGLGTSTYFEYGTTVNMTSVTTAKLMTAGTSVPFSDFVSGLAPNTIYFFRANATNANGRVYGDIKIFKTLANTTNPTVITRTVTTRTGVESPVMLKIENRYQVFRIGDIIDYTVTYKNIGNDTLRNPLLQVILPAHVQYTNSSRGTYAVETNTLSVPLQDLQKDEGGVVYVQGVVISLPENNAEIVSTALLAYTNSIGAQEDAMAYVLNRGAYDIANNNLSANALFASGFLPGDLCGWLLIIVFILLMALLIRWILGDRERKNSSNNNS